MGNTVAKEFHATQLGRCGSPEMVLRGKNSTTIVEKDILVVYGGQEEHPEEEGLGLVGKKKNNQLLRLAARQYIYQDTKQELFRADYNLKSSSSSCSSSPKRTSSPSSSSSIASDRNGTILYVDKKIVMPDGQKRTMIYKTCPVYPNQPPAAASARNNDDNNMIHMEAAMMQLYLAAIVFDCGRHQANQNTACAILSIVTGKNKLDDTGCELQDLYKAIKIPKVKNGVLVIDMMNGRPVGKKVGTTARPSSTSAPASASGCCCDAASTTSSSRGASSSSYYHCSELSSLSMSNMTSSAAATTTAGVCWKGSAAAAAATTTVYEIAPGADATAVIAVASSLF
jgi:hypothetical protein